jgi:hypothetical protein
MAIGALRPTAPRAPKRQGRSHQGRMPTAITGRRGGVRMRKRLLVVHSGLPSLGGMRLSQGTLLWLGRVQGPMPTLV